MPNPGLGHGLSHRDLRFFSSRYRSPDTAGDRTIGLELESPSSTFGGMRPMVRSPHGSTLRLHKEGLC